MARPKEKNAVRLQLSVDEKTYSRLDELAAAYGGSKSRVVDILVREAEIPYVVNSSVPPGEAAAGPVAVAALTGRGPTPPVGGSSGAASSPARAGRTAKARQQ